MIKAQPPELPKPNNNNILCKLQCSVPFPEAQRRRGAVKQD